jgi:hypothetical protein
MLPLEVRKNRLLTIHIRAIALELTKYKLHVLNEEGNEYISNDTENTMVLISKFYEFILYLHYF